jgi:hypothetical protein
MGNLFVNRMNSRQGIVKKEQETFFKKSIGLEHHLKFSFKDTISACDGKWSYEEIIILPIIVFKAYAACTDLNALDNDASMTAS